MNRSVEVGSDVGAKGRSRALRGDLGVDVDVVAAQDTPDEAPLIALLWTYSQPDRDVAGLSRPQPRYTTRPAHVAFARDRGQSGAPAIGIAVWEPVGEGAVARPYIVVDKAYRGRGVGIKLLQWLISDARKEGVERLSAHVERDAGAVLRLLHRVGHHPHVQFGSGDVTFDLPLRDRR